jgi:hypothetical protein
MSDEPSIKELLKRSWQLRLESTQVKLQLAQTIAESLCRNLERILSPARKRRGPRG